MRNPAASETACTISWSTLSRVRFELMLVAISRTFLIRAARFRLVRSW